MATMAQLNVRMSPEIKAAGDSVLDLYGVSPTELIRSLWQKIALGEEALEQVVQVLAADPAAGSARPGSPTGTVGGISQMVRQRQEAFERDLGLSRSTYVPLSDEELEELAYEDYLEGAAQKGAGHGD